jgi:6,7-dimethyl-8-ribityllumazine synthase
MSSTDKLVIDNRGAKPDCKLAIVVSRFNDEITTKLLSGAIARFKSLGKREEDLAVVWVPGAVEIPLTVKYLAEDGLHDAIIALGAVIRGETTHYDYVCKLVSDGCQKISLDYDLPVIFGVLTTENEEQALERCGGKHGHKGADAVDAALEMVATLRQLSN